VRKQFVPQIALYLCAYDMARPVKKPTAEKLDKDQQYHERAHKQDFVADIGVFVNKDGFSDIADT